MMVDGDIDTPGFPGTGAIPIALRGPVAVGKRANVVECGGPPPLFWRPTTVPMLTESAMEWLAFTRLFVGIGFGRMAM